ncbi:hypothetical protein [Cupriavidus oxalaticus]|jgi:hypothetical protein|nr:hypothetical protein [Cupriavidus oxalaticus]
MHDLKQKMDSPGVRVDASVTRGVNALWHRKSVAKNAKARQFAIAFKVIGCPVVSDNFTLRERFREHEKMAEQDPPKKPASGLKPIERHNSEERLSRLTPTTASATLHAYCSKFARDFLDAHFYFCSSKFVVARGGKVKALDEAFRDAEEWYAGALSWLSTTDQIEIPLFYEEKEVKVSHSFAGRLLRLLMQFDRIFLETLYSQECGSISADQRTTTIEIAAKRITAIHQLCIPDTDKFDADGTLISSHRSSSNGHA